MLRVCVLILLAFFCCNSITAQATPRIQLNEGAVLVYKIKEGTKSYNYTVTITSKDYDLVKFEWATSEATPRKGTVITAPDYDETDVEHLLITDFKTGEEELEYDQSGLFVPLSIVAKIEVNGEQEIDFDINGKASSFNPVKGPVKGSKKLLYNKVAINTQYTEVANKPAAVTLGYTSFEISGDYIVSFYADKNITMQLISVKTPVEEVSVMPAKKSVKEKPAVLTKMDPTKFSIVKTKYPTLAKLENFDPTKGGSVPRPFMETYEYRLGSNTKNPPSLVDCFICDLKILFNQKDKFYSQTGTIDETIANKSLPATLATKLMQIYLNAEVSKTPGYRPWTHNQFVKSLTETERSNLARDVEQYVKAYGILDVN